MIPNLHHMTTAEAIVRGWHHDDGAPMLINLIAKALAGEREVIVRTLVDQLVTAGPPKVASDMAHWQRALGGIHDLADVVHEVRTEVHAMHAALRTATPSPDSPNFEPQELRDFRARGFERVNVPHAEPKCPRCLYNVVASVQRRSTEGMEWLCERCDAEIAAMPEAPTKTAEEPVGLLQHIREQQLRSGPPTASTQPPVHVQQESLEKHGGNQHPIDHCPHGHKANTTNMGAWTTVTAPAKCRLCPPDAVLTTYRRS